MMVRSSDGTEIWVDVSGGGDTALVFVHGWMGNGRWWDAQREAFSGTHQIVTMDLAGHGRSGKRVQGSAQGYADDIVAAVGASSAARVVIVGHSMAGGYALVACPGIERLAALILVDTLKNLEGMPEAAQVDGMLASYRADYPAAVASVLPRFLFAPKTPSAVAERLTSEFLTVSGDTAAGLLEPLYRMDVRAAAQGVRVPVRGIGTDLHPHDLEINRRYFGDYGYVELAGYGHYPMLEAPGAFNEALRGELGKLGC